MGLSDFLAIFNIDVLQLLEIIHILYKTFFFILFNEVFYDHFIKQTELHKMSHQNFVFSALC